MYPAIAAAGDRANPGAVHHMVSEIGRGAEIAAWLDLPVLEKTLGFFTVYPNSGISGFGPLRPVADIPLRAILAVRRGARGLLGSGHSLNSTGCI